MCSNILIWLYSFYMYIHCVHLHINRYFHTKFYFPHYIVFNYSSLLKTYSYNLYPLQSNKISKRYFTVGIFITETTRQEQHQLSISHQALVTDAIVPLSLNSVQLPTPVIPYTLHNWYHSNWQGVRLFHETQRREALLQPYFDCANGAARRPEELPYSENCLQGL